MGSGFVGSAVREQANRKLRETHVLVAAVLDRAAMFAMLAAQAV